MVDFYHFLQDHHIFFIILTTYITFAETTTTTTAMTTTHVEEQQQQVIIQEHQQQEQQIQQVAEQIIMKKEKIKKHKKQKAKLQEQEQEQEQAEQITEQKIIEEEEEVTTKTKRIKKPKIRQETEESQDFTDEATEPLQKLEESFEHIQPQSIYEQRIESIPLSGVPELSTTQAKPVKADTEYASAKRVVLQEEHISQEKVMMLRKIAAESIMPAPSLEKSELKAPEMQEMETMEFADNIQPEQQKLKTAKTSRNIQKSKPLDVEIPQTEEAMSELKPLDMMQQFAKSELVSLKIAREQTEVVAAQNVESIIKEPSINYEAKMQQMENKSLMVQQVESSENLEDLKELEKPKLQQLPAQHVLEQQPLEIQQTEPIDSSQTLEAAPEATKFKASPEFVPALGYESQQIIAIEQENKFDKISDLSVKAVNVEIHAQNQVIQIEQINTAEAWPQERQHKPTKTEKAFQNLVLQESYETTMVDQQSPIEETNTQSIAATQTASIDMRKHEHIVQTEAEMEEEKPKPLPELEKPKLMQALKGQDSVLLLGQTYEMQPEESLKQLPEYQGKTKAIKTNITQANPLVESMQMPTFEAEDVLSEVKPNLEYSKSKLSNAEVVASISEIVTQDKEELLEKFQLSTAEAIPSYNEQQAVNIGQGFVVESEQPMQLPAQPLSQKADRTATGIELKLPNIEETHVAHGTQPLQLQQDRAAQALVSLNTIKAALKHEQDLLESSSALPSLIQPTSTNALSNLSELQQSSVIMETLSHEAGSKLEIPQLETQQGSTNLTDSKQLAETTEILALQSLKEAEQFTKPTASQAEASICSQLSKVEEIQTVLHNSTNMSMEAKPVTQLVAQTLNLQEALDIREMQLQDKEYELKPQDTASTKEATLLTNAGLLIPKSDLQQTLESVHQLQEIPTDFKFALKNVNEISSAVIEESQTLENIKQQEVKPMPTSEYSMASIETHKTQTVVSAVLSEEKENVLNIKEFLPSQQAVAHLQDTVQKLAITQCPNIQDSVGELKGLESLEMSCKPKTDNLSELIMQQVNILEKEQQLMQKEKLSEQLAKTTISTELLMANIKQQQQFLEQPIKMETTKPKTELAQSVESHQLKAPVVETVQEEENIDKLQEMKYIPSRAMIQQGLETESITSEVIGFENLSSLSVMEKSQQTSQSSLVLNENLSITQQMPLEVAKTFEHKPDFDFKNANKALPAQRQTAISNQLDSYMSTADLKTAEMPTDHAKYVEGSNVMQTHLVEQKQLFESTATLEEQMQATQKQAQVQHVLQNVAITDLQEAVDAALLMPNDKQMPLSQASLTGREANLQLPTVAQVAVEDNMGLVPELEKENRQAKLFTEGTEHEIITSQVEPIEHFDQFEKGELGSKKANLLLEENFLPTQIKSVVSLLVSEDELQPFKPSEQMAKSFVEGMLRETTVTDITAYEKSDSMPVTEFSGKTATALIDDSTPRQAQSQSLDTIMHKEQSLKPAQPEQHAKPFIEGTQRETLISETIPLESLSKAQEFKPQAQEPKHTETDNLKSAQAVHIPTVLEKETLNLSECLKEQLAISSLEGSKNSNLVSDIIPFETLNNLMQSKDLKQQPKITQQDNLMQAQTTLTQQTFIKEENLQTAKMEQEKATVSLGQSQKALITEEVVTESQIIETYDLKQQQQQVASVLITADKKTPLDNTKIQTYEEIGGIMTFTPKKEEGLQPIITTADLRTTVIDEVIPLTGIADLDVPQQQKRESKQSMHPDLLNKLVVSQYTTLENIENLNISPTTKEEANILLPQDTKVAIKTTHEISENLEKLSPAPSIPQENANLLVNTQNMYITENVLVTENINEIEKLKTIQETTASLVITPHHGINKSEINTYDSITETKRQEHTQNKANVAFDAHHTPVHLIHKPQESPEDLEILSEYTTKEATGIIGTHESIEQVEMISLETEQIFTPQSQKKTQLLRNVLELPKLPLATQTENVLSEATQSLTTKIPVEKTVTSKEDNYHHDTILTEIPTVYNTTKDIDEILAEKNIAIVGWEQKERSEIKTKVVKSIFGKYFNLENVRENLIWRILPRNPHVPKKDKNTHITQHQSINYLTHSLTNISLHRYYNTNNTHTRTHIHTN